MLVYLNVVVVSNLCILIAFLGSGSQLRAVSFFVYQDKTINENCFDINQLAHLLKSKQLIKFSDYNIRHVLYV